MQLKIYGIPNCDVTKKALNWLDQQKIEYEFNDYKLQPPAHALLLDWCSRVNWTVLLNKKSTTWRELDSKIQSVTVSEPAAIRLMMNSPSIIKRPVVDTDTALLVGFDAAKWAAALGVNV